LAQTYSNNKPITIKLNKPSIVNSVGLGSCDEDIKIEFGRKEQVTRIIEHEVEVDDPDSSVIAGYNWEPVNSNITTQLNSVCYGNGKYVAVGLSGVVLYSTDGEIWTKATTGRTHTFNWVCYGNGKFVATKGGANSTDLERIAYSTDGINWNYVNIPIGGQTSNTYRSLNKIFFYNNYYVAFTNTSDYNDIMCISSNGINWSFISDRNNFKFTGSDYTIDTYNKLILLVGSRDANGTQNKQYLRMSTDNFNPTNNDNWLSASVSSSGLSNNTQFNNICVSNNNIYLIQLNNNGALLRKNESGTWSNINNSLIGTAQAIIFENGHFIFSSSYGIFTSKDGIDWDKRYITTSTIRDICFNNGIFIAVGNDGTILKSKETIGKKIIIVQEVVVEEIDTIFDTFTFKPLEAGLFLFNKTYSDVNHIILTLGNNKLGRFAFGYAHNIPTSIAKELTFNSTIEPRVTLSGQVIKGLGGYNYKTLSLDSRYKVDEKIMNDIKEGYKQISKGLPFFIDLTNESYKLPFNKLYAIDTNQQNFGFESGVKKYLHSRRWNFKECF